MLQSFFITAFRSFSRNKIYTVINVLGLALGLACAMLIILYTKDEYSYDQFHHNRQHIYRIVSKETNPDGSIARYNTNTGYFHGQAFSNAVPELSTVIRFNSESKNIKKGTEILTEEAHKTDAAFLTTFSFPLLYGDAKTALTHPASVVISEDMAIKYFGTRNAVGKTLEMKVDSVFKPFSVTAVTRRCPQNSTIKFQILTPNSKEELMQTDKRNWFNFFLNTFVVLPEGTDVASVNEKMQRFYETDAKDVMAEMKSEYGITTQSQYMLQPLLDIHLNKNFGASNGLSDGSNPLYSYILSGIALFILLIASINFVNLTIAHSIKRSKEIGIRKVIGSSRHQLVLQFLGESFILCLIAFLLACGLVEFMLPTFNSLANKALSLSYLIDAKLISGYIGLLVATALLSGFYPAWVLSSFNPVKTLYSRFKYGGKNYLQQSLVIVQFTLSTLLIIATLTIYKQFNYLTTKPLGYDDTHLMQVEKWGISRSEYLRFAEQLSQHSNIVGTALKNDGWWNTVAKLSDGSQIDFAFETINPSYLPLLKISLAQGRNFSADFPSDSGNSILVNESFVRKAGFKNPIGEKVNFWYQNKQYQIVGVVKDYHYAGINRTIDPQLFTMKPDNDYGVVFIKIKAGSEKLAVPFVEQTFKQMFPLFPFSYSFTADNNRKLYESEDKWRQMMLFGAVITIFISCIGLFGLSVLNAEKRTKEIGIRKVLGASVSGIATKLSFDFIRLVFISLAIAMPIAWILANKWLSDYPYRIEMGWSLFVFAFLLVSGIALATVSVQAIKTAVGKPVNNLRTE